MTFKPLQRCLIALALLLPSVALASDAPASQPDWIPAGVEQLGKTAAFHTDFTFDRSMLQMASGLIDGGDADTRNAAIRSLNAYHLDKRAKEHFKQAVRRHKTVLNAVSYK